MKLFLRILCFALATLILMSSFVACDNNKKSRNNEDESSKNDNSETSDETSVPLEDLIIGTYAEFPPFVSVSVGEGVIGKFDGIDMEIVKRVAEENGMKPIIEDMEFDELILALEDDRVDMVIAGMTIGPERAEKVDFSIPYYEATQVMIVKEGSDIKSASDMADKKIAVMKDYAGEYYVDFFQQEYGGYEYKSFESVNDVIQELSSGNFDVAVVDSTTAEKIIRDNKGLKIVRDSEVFISEQYGIAVKKGNTELLDKINKSLEKMIENGDIEEWAIQYSKPVVSM